MDDDEPTPTLRHSRPSRTTVEGIKRDVGELRIEGRSRRVWALSMLVPAVALVVWLARQPGRDEFDKATERARTVELNMARVETRLDRFEHLLGTILLEIRKTPSP
jgi:hypothetical protein